MVEFKIRKKCDFCGLEYWEDGRINKHYCISDSPTPPLMVDKCRDCKTISVLTDTIRILKTPMWFDRKPAETPPTTEKSCGNCEIVQSLIDMNKKLRKTVVISTPTQTDEDVLTGIIETQLNARKYRSKQFDIENKELAQEILKHFMRIKKG